MQGRKKPFFYNNIELIHVISSVVSVPFHFGKFLHHVFRPQSFRFDIEEQTDPVESTDELIEKLMVAMDTELFMSQKV